MPSYRQRKDHIDLWLEELGFEIPRAQITPDHIRTVLQRWRLTLGPATCNKRRTALMHLWSVLDGKGARNPVRDVRKFRVDDPLPRGRDPHIIDIALRGAPLCRSRAFLRVLLWTGMRPVELERAQPDDLHEKERRLVIRTAKGGRTRVIPLGTQAISAFREFDDLNCWNWKPSAAPLNRLLKKWTGLDLRVYDLRHTYATALALRGTRLDVIGAMLGHSTLNLTTRYTLAALETAAVTATQRLERKAAQ